MENKWGMYMKTSISEKIAYGMGDVACNVVYALTSGLIVYFYTNVIGVSAGVVGTILWYLVYNKLNLCYIFLR